MSTEMTEYIPVLIMMAAGVVIAGAGMLVSNLLGPKVFGKVKDAPFECGVPPFGNVKHRISVRFYLVAILFLLFDVEVIFFYPWAIAYKKYLEFGPFIVFEMAAFVGLLLVGYYYVLRKGALKWD